jgi:general secretion pathway protein J
VAETDEAGFTLVEMVVSLAVTALIGLLLIQSLQTTGLITRNAKRLAAQEEVEHVRGHLRSTLAGVVRRHRDGQRVPFLGQDGRLMATIGANEEAERVAAMQLALAVAASPDGTGLALVEQTRTASSDAAAEQSEVLLDRIVGLRLRYFGVPGEAGVPDWQPRWVATWTRKDRLPVLVEVSVDFPAADSRRWPALVLPLGVGS